ncbi:T9SS type B sorting domain-containing protein [Flavobacterium sp.]|uniref:T9SS type B sorting domain-containing protein n=1 Tax=Flavobacterium sp. TaxID=239 RepID=UPI0037BF602E
MNPVPLGDYVIELIDDCTGVVLTTTVTVPIYTDKGIGTTNRPGCDIGKGSLKLWSYNGDLTTVKITAAPTAYNFILPNDVSSSIVSTGILYLDDLPPGSYTFETIDECNFSNTVNVNVLGYDITSSNYSMITNCGSFDILLNFVSNGIDGQSFWLQKLIDPVTNQWGNPSTNVIYNSNTIPNSTNSIQLNNLTTNFNFSFNGTFRIVRHFYSFQNGTNYNSGVVPSVDKSCIEVLTPTFTFNESLEVLGFNRMPCNLNGNLDVIINALGSNPLHYTIINKNGIPFLLDNGNSNIFNNLPSATYTFQIEDNCGNIITRVIDISSLVSLVLITKPNDMLICTDVITNNEIFDISSQSGVIVGQQINLNYTLTYHTSLTDAQSNLNPISSITNFNPTSNPQTIYARLRLNNMPDCYEVTSFDLIVGQNPKLLLDDEYLFCDQSSVTINASSMNLPNTTYVWSNGVTGPEATITTIDETNLTVTATNSYGAQNLSCSTSKSITVVLSEAPVIERIETIDWTGEENSISVITSINGAYEYSLDGINYQDNNKFENLLPGLYSVYVRDKAGCGVTIKTVWLLYYLKYFTPNADGYNDYWQIPFSENKKELQVVVYDRFGKIVTSFTSQSQGWDGTYNGNLMVSDDYWFVVYRIDGRIHKGHFCMKR